MMIDTAPLRAALIAAHGQPLEVLPDDMERLLNAIDDGNAAQLQQQLSTAIARIVVGAAA